MTRPGLLRGLFLAIGIGLLGGAAWSWQRTDAFIASAARAEGTVVDFQQQTDSDGATTWRPVVVFTTEDGDPRRFTSDLGNNPPSYQVGEKVTVLYRSDDPTQAEIGDFMSLWFVTLLLGVLGSAFAVTGVFALRQEAA